MKDKEMIEKMAQDIKKTEKDVYSAVVKETQAFVKKHHKYNSKEDYSLAHDKPVNERVAEALYNLGYRKIDKDSVVLNSEQYSNYLITQTNNEFLKEQAEKLKADIERLYKNIGKFIVSKEKDTAEKILKWLKEHCDFVGFVLVETYFKEEFGVEVDE